MDDERRHVLERVASGELSPAEAAALLDALEAGAGGTQATATARRPEPGPNRIARVRIVRTLWPVEVTGDVSVREAVAEGPHLARRIDDVLVIEGEPDEQTIAGFWFSASWPGGHRHAGWPPVGPAWPGRASLRQAQRMVASWPWRPPAAWLRVRLNPDLPLEIEAQASSVRVREVRAPIRIEVQAGQVALEGCPGPLEVSVQAGIVNLRGRLAGGASRIHCEAGTVRVHLEHGSSVRVTAASTLGRVSLDDVPSPPPWTVGAGEGSLEIRNTMGSVRVTTAP